MRVTAEGREEATVLERYNHEIAEQRAMRETEKGSVMVWKRRGDVWSYVIKGKTAVEAREEGEGSERKLSAYCVMMAGSTVLISQAS